MTRSLLLTLVMVVFSAPFAHAQNMMVVGYYPSYRHATYPHTAIKFENITHLAHSFIWPNSDGSGELVVPAGFLYPDLIDSAHAEGVRVVVSLGGAGNTSGFGPAASDPASRAELVENIVSFVQDQGYDGVDLDWEGFTDATYRSALTALIQDLSAALDAADPDLTLSMPIGATNWHGAYDMPAVVDNLDWVAVMTYDFHGTWTPDAGYNSPLHPAEGDEDHFSLSQSVEYWLDRGVPRDKMLAGMAFYGVQWEGVSEAMGPRTGAVTALTYSDISPLVGAEGWERHWDNVAMVPYLLNPDDDVFISFDDAESISAKVDFILSEELAGGIIWEISQDYLPGGEQPLFAAAGELIHAAVAIDEDRALPTSSSLTQNYPNPFSSSTTIPFEVEQTTHVTIEIFDVLGKKLLTLVDGVYAAGSHSTRWTPDNLASGIYVYRMRAGTRSQAGTLMLTR